MINFDSEVLEAKKERTELTDDEIFLESRNARSFSDGKYLEDNVRFFDGKFPAQEFWV